MVNCDVVCKTVNCDMQAELLISDLTVLHDVSVIYRHIYAESRL